MTETPAYPGVYIACRYCGAKSALDVTRVGGTARAYLCETCKRVWVERSDD